LLNFAAFNPTLRGLTLRERFSSLKSFALKANVKRGLSLRRSAQICRAGGSGTALSRGLPPPLLGPPAPPRRRLFFRGFPAGRGRQVQLLWYDRHSNLALRSWLPRLNLTGRHGKKKGGEPAGVRGRRRRRAENHPAASAHLSAGGMEPVTSRFAPAFILGRPQSGTSALLQVPSYLRLPASGHVCPAFVSWSSLTEESVPRGLT